MSPRTRTPRSRRRRLHPLAVAAVVVAATAALTFYAFNQSLPFVHRFTLHALLDNSVNVRSGDPVRIAGINVGVVTGVAPAGARTRISFTLQPAALPVHRDATIRIRDRLFLEGSYYLELDPGSPSAPALGDGGTIGASQTSSPVQFFQVLSLFTAPIRADLTGTLSAFAQAFAAAPGRSPSDSGAGAIKRWVPELEPLLSDTAQISRSLQGTAPGDVGRLLRSSASLASTLGSSSQQLAGLVRGLGTTATALQASDGALAQTVSGLDQTLIAAPPALSAIDSALAPVRELARALDPSLRVAPPILDGLLATVRQLSSVLAPAQRGPLLASLKATFEELPSLISSLASAFPIGKQVTDCLLTHVTPVLRASVPDGSLSTGRPVWQDFAHFLPGVAGASGSFDANGPYTRFLVGAGSNTLSGAVGGQQLVSTAPPGGSALQGARPQWIGDLTAADFHPEANCAAQKLPTLASPTAAPDLVAHP